MSLHKNMRRLRSLIPVDALWEKSQQGVDELVTRWDVPSHVVDTNTGAMVPVREDLRDARPRFNGLPGGRHVTARIHALDDMNWGSPSSAEPLLVMLVPILASLTQFGSFIAVPAVLALLPVLYAIHSVMGARRMVMVALLGGLLPCLWGSILGAFTGMDRGGLWSSGPSALLLPVGSLVAAVLLISLFAPAGQVKGSLKQAALLVGGVAVAALVSLALSRWLPFLPAVAPWVLGCSLPLLMAWQDYKARADVLREQDLRYGSSENAGLLRTAHIDARKVQAERAARDETQFVELGRATGLATQKQDGYAPDAGLLMGLTQYDCSTHIFCLGETNSGKTSGLLRPVASGLLRLNRAPLGALVMDAKGSLPFELSDLPDYTLIQPGMDIALIQGLMPEEVVEAILAIVTNKATGEDSFWNSSGRTLLLSSLVVQRALCDLRTAPRTELAEMASRSRAAWTLQTTRDFLVLAQARPEDGMDALLTLAAFHDDADTGSLLDDALVYFSDELANMDDKTKSNIFATVSSWLSPIFQHRDLLRWTQIETGYDPSEVLFGKRCGVALPEVRYGKAGMIAANLIKQRVYAGIRRRGERPFWDKEGTGETQVLVLVDECQDLIGAPEMAIAPIGRSLGLILCLATQTVENLIVRLGGEAQARGFLASFLSKICLRSSPMTIEWMARELGESELLVSDLRATGINLEATSDRFERSSLLDVAHPNAAYHQHVLRDALRESGSHRQVIKGASSGRISVNHHVLPDLVVGTQWVKQTLFSPSELAAYLAPNYRALAMIQRAGVKRRDIIDLKPIYPEKKPAQDRRQNQEAA
ncbi:TraM recognition domain-containing protein [Bacillus sp. NP157]|nr:TraM recognition domain-containing protein [Bacillus sp. NP157]